MQGLPPDPAPAWQLPLVVPMLHCAAHSHHMPGLGKGCLRQLHHVTQSGEEHDDLEHAWLGNSAILIGQAQVVHSQHDCPRQHAVSLDRLPECGFWIS